MSTTYAEPTATFVFSPDLPTGPEFAITPEYTAKSIAILREHIDSGDALKQGIGAINPERVKDFYQKTVDAGLLTAGQIKPEDSYTTQFVNKGTGLDVRKHLTAGK